MQGGSIEEGILTNMTPSARIWSGDEEEWEEGPEGNVGGCNGV